MRLARLVFNRFRLFSPLFFGFPFIRKSQGQHRNSGFGLDKSDLRHSDRLARLLIAVFLAYIWMIFLGALVITDHHLGLIARTDRFTNSLFQLGRAYLDRILEEGWDIPVSVALPDPRSFVHLVLV